MSGSSILFSTLGDRCLELGGDHYSASAPSCCRSSEKQLSGLSSSFGLTPRLTACQAEPAIVVEGDGLGTFTSLTESFSRTSRHQEGNISPTDSCRRGSCNPVESYSDGDSLSTRGSGELRALCDSCSALPSMAGRDSRDKESDPAAVVYSQLPEECAPLLSIILRDHSSSDIDTFSSDHRNCISPNCTAGGGCGSGLAHTAFSARNSPLQGELRTPRSCAEQRRHENFDHCSRHARSFGYSNHCPRDWDVAEIHKEVLAITTVPEHLYDLSRQLSAAESSKVSSFHGASCKDYPGSALDGSEPRFRVSGLRKIFSDLFCCAN